MIRDIGIGLDWCCVALVSLAVGATPSSAGMADDKLAQVTTVGIGAFKQNNRTLADAKAPEASSSPRMVGELTRHVARHEDTLVDLARQYNVGYTELRSANPNVDPWLPGRGTEILIPTAHLLPESAHEGLVVNLADQRLYYFPTDGGRIITAPIGIGSDGWATPTGRTWVIKKRKRPTWYVPKSIRAEDPELPAIVPPGPDNPLGEFAIYLGWRSYVIHGTNQPFGVGRRVSHGCVRLYPEDIAWLFKHVEIGTPVTVLDEPVKLAWIGDELMLEVHPSQTQADDVEAGELPRPEAPAEYHYRILEKAGQFGPLLDWRRIGAAIRARSGLPVSILKRDDAAG